MHQFFKHKLYKFFTVILLAYSSNAYTDVAGPIPTPSPSEFIETYASCVEVAEYEYEVCTSDIEMWEQEILDLIERGELEGDELLDELDAIEAGAQDCVDGYEEALQSCELLPGKPKPEDEDKAQENEDDEELEIPEIEEGELIDELPEIDVF